MAESKKVKITMTFSESTLSRMNHLKAMLGIIQLRDLLNFAMSLTLLIVEGVVAGKKLAFYDEATDTVSLIKHADLGRIAELRNSD